LLSYGDILEKVFIELLETAGFTRYAIPTEGLVVVIEVGHVV